MQREASGRDMDAEIWKHLPDELLEPILGRLPWWSNLAMRLVCRSWNRLLRGLEFLRNTRPPSDSGRHPCWISRSRDANYAIRDWTRNKSSTLSNLPATDPPFRVVAAAGGLLLMVNDIQPSKMISIIANPLNGSRKELPPVPELGDSCMCKSLGMVEDKKTNTHKITKVVYSEVASFSGVTAQEAIYVFDLKRDSWEMAYKTLRPHDEYRAIIKAVFLQNDLYILTAMPSSHEERWLYRVFKVLPTHWDEIAPDFSSNHSPSEHLTNVHLFCHRRGLFLVGDRRVLNSSTVRIWKLNPAMTAWEMAFVMPDELLLRLYVPRRGIRFKVYMEGDYACFSGDFRDTIITCDILSGVWSLSTGSYKFVGDSEFLLEPRLEIVL